MDWEPRFSWVCLANEIDTTFTHSKYLTNQATSVWSLASSFGGWPLRGEPPFVHSENSNCEARHGRTSRANQEHGVAIFSRAAVFAIGCFSKKISPKMCVSTPFFKFFFNVTFLLPVNYLITLFQADSLMLHCLWCFESWQQFFCVRFFFSNNWLIDVWWKAASIFLLATHFLQMILCWINFGYLMFNGKINYGKIFD